MAIRKNRRIQDILNEKHEAEERKEARQDMIACLMALPLAMATLILI